MIVKDNFVDDMFAELADVTYRDEVYRKPPEAKRIGYWKWGKQFHPSATSYD
jgi:hypothetical protein